MKKNPVQSKSIRKKCHKNKQKENNNYLFPMYQEKKNKLLKMNNKLLKNRKVFKVFEAKTSHIKQKLQCQHPNLSIRHWKKVKKSSTQTISVRLTV